MSEALFYTSKPNAKVRCNLCPHSCILSDGESGLCRVRFNSGGKLLTGVYGEVAALHVDPIEKKPLYHFYPGSEILSVGTAGCNLVCPFCQNYSLSQYDCFSSPAHLKISPGELVDRAAKAARNIGIAYTYNEPTVFYEMMLHTATMANNAGLKNVVVSNGYIQQKPLEQLIKVTDGYNIDLKAFNNGFYRKQTGGSLNPVLNTLKTIHQSGKHLEITLLVIPTLNDDEEEFKSLTDWISCELSAEVPLHLSRYFPAWKLNIPSTSVETLLQFAHIAGKKLHYVYTGNMAHSHYSSTWCPNCNYLLIKRDRYNITVVGLSKNRKCDGCGADISIII